MHKSEVLAQAQKLGLKGVMSDGYGLYTCNSCGAQWRSRSRTLWWPISLGLEPALSRQLGRVKPWRERWFARWVWQTGWDGIEQRVFGQTIRIGSLLIKFGPVSK